MASPVITPPPIEIHQADLHGQFEHKQGVVKKIDTDTAQLVEAVRTGSGIIITTLQKFSFVLDKVKDLPSRSYAVIVDEAHSSQTGEAAKDLRIALSGSEEQELTAAEAEDDGLVAKPVDPVEEAMARAVAGRGPQANLSFFAFTATPKAKTLELFGRWNPDAEKYEASHLYSMRQAIEEGFILDVLANYATYKTYWRIQKAVETDPEYDEVKARRAIARFVDLHPHNLVVDGGRLRAVIDFGDITAGDPATDLAIAWMLLPPEVRPVLRAEVGVDRATWARGRGWALTLGLAYLANSVSTPGFGRLGAATIDAVLADWAV